jgi:signal transduction histidine kinase
VSEARRREAERLHSQKLESIGQLAAGIAHEINTPMQYIGDNAHFLRRGFKVLLGALGEYRKLLEDSRVPTEIGELRGDLDRRLKLDFLTKRVPRALESNLEGVAAVPKIVAAMKTFSHPGVDEMRLEDLNHAIETTVTVSRNAWKYVADMQLEMDPNLPLVPCCVSELSQVFLNLIVNAAQAIEDGLARDGEKGTIRISSTRSQTHVEVRVYDTGPGVAEQARARVFDPFFTTKEVGRGTGQGLAIARAIVREKHRGTISFETETGKGTTFVVRLPLDHASAE